jgi:carbamoyl-phosphate synthase large subunit
MRSLTGGKERWTSTPPGAITWWSSLHVGPSRSFRDPDRLGTQMKAVGEVMSIGKTYKEAFQKSIRSLEIGRYGLGLQRISIRKPGRADGSSAEPTSERQFVMYEALRKGAGVEDLYKKTHIKPWFIHQMKDLVELEGKILPFKRNSVPEELLIQAKKDGFSDRYLAKLLDIPERDIRERRTSLGMVQAGRRCR